MMHYRKILYCNTQYITIFYFVSPLHAKLIFIAIDELQLIKRVMQLTSYNDRINYLFKFDNINY